MRAPTRRVVVAAVVLAATHGHLLVLTFDADTLEGADLELGDHPVEVERLGAVQNLAAG